MRNFSIISSWDRDPVDQYTDFLTHEVYKSAEPWSRADIEDPLFLQKLGVLRAAGIQRAIETNGAVMCYGLYETNDNIRQSAQYISRQLGASASIITSSLDKGFTALNHSLGYIGGSIDTANNHLANISGTLGNINSNLEGTNKNLQTLGRATVHGFATLHRDFSVLHKDLEYNGQLQLATNEKLSDIHKSLNAVSFMTGQGFSRLYNQFTRSNTLLNEILTELQIPETQRERRSHIEKGSKFLAWALADNDKWYFKDAIDEFGKATDIEPTDFFSWYNLGFIYLRSTDFLDIQKATDAFERYIHYAKVEIAQQKNKDLEHQMDNVYLMMAELKYLQKLPKDAVSLTENCKCLRGKADFMKAKYLSATYQRDNQEMAAEILHKLIDANPLLSLQILEDNDLIANEYVTQLLESLRQEAVGKSKKSKQLINNRISEYVREISDYNTEINLSHKMIGTTFVQPISYRDFSEELKSIEILINNSTYLESIEAERQIADLNIILEKKWEADRVDYKKKIDELDRIKKSRYSDARLLLKKCNSIDNKINNLLQHIDESLNLKEHRLGSIKNIVLRLSTFNTDLKYVLDRIEIKTRHIGNNADYRYKLSGNLKILDLEENSSETICNPRKHKQLSSWLNRDKNNTLLAIMSTYYKEVRTNLSNYKRIFAEYKKERSLLQLSKNKSYETLLEQINTFQRLLSRYRHLENACLNLLSSSRTFIDVLYPSSSSFRRDLHTCESILSRVSSFENYVCSYHNLYSLFSFKRRRYENALAELRIMTTKAKHISRILELMLEQE